MNSDAQRLGALLWHVGKKKLLVFHIFLSYITLQQQRVVEISLALSNDLGADSGAVERHSRMHHKASKWIISDLH